MDRWLAAEALAKRQAGVITRSQLKVLGLKRGAVGWMLDQQRLEVLFRGVYRFSLTQQGWFQRAIAAQLLLGASAALSHFSALSQWDLRGVDIPTDVLHFSVADRSRHQLSDHMVLHRPTVPFRIYRRGRLRVTGLARTLIDLAALVSPDQLEGYLDAAQKRYSSFPDWLRRGLAQTPSRTHPGVRHLKELFATRTGSPAESPLETRAWQQLRAHGLPQPIRQYSISDAAGFVGFADLAWPDHLVCAQLDSVTWHSLGPRFHLDAQQRIRLAAAGWLCLTITSRMLRTGEVFDRIKEVLSRNQPQRSLFVPVFPHGDRPR